MIVGPAVKICGLKRPADAAAAAAAGARYVGAILAGGPRLVTPDGARAVFEQAGSATRVVVVGHEPVDDIVRAGMAAGADIVQLHGDPSPRMVLDLRERWPGGIWAALRVPPDAFDSERAAALFAVADGVVLDAFVPGQLGGTGVPIDWRALRAPLAAVRALAESSALLVLAGGLSPQNVGTSARLLTPDVVDVSSGVESAPAIKDHARVQRFIAAARGDGEDGEQLSFAGVQ
ncbi:MAG TPA: phosphoribosylanthranilate isomerase [Gemmatimonadaceae bacterium]|nr:phosphoribosylanthranilate isomerase [Gemmatimonadaceae bacterium]